MPTAIKKQLESIDAEFHEDIKQMVEAYQKRTGYFISEISIGRRFPIQRIGHVAEEDDVGYTVSGIEITREN